MAWPRMTVMRGGACLLAGAVTSVVVAWMFATAGIWKNMDMVSDCAWLTSDPRVCVMRAEFEGLGRSVTCYGRHDVISVHESAVVYVQEGGCGGYDPQVDLAMGEPPSDAEFPSNTGDLFRSTFGIPFRCMIHKSGIPAVDGAFHHVWVGTVLLPVWPVWGGMAGDAVVYGTGWYGLIGAVGFARGAVRRRRGGCVECGYSRVGLDEGVRCPECGRRG